MITDKITIPLLKSAVTAVLISLFAAALYGVSLGVTAWRLFWVVLAGFTMITWLLQMPDKKILHDRSESKVFPTMSKPLKVSIRYNDGQAGLFSEFAIHRDQFIAWCIGADQGRSIGENHWTGAQAIFSKPEYHAFRDELKNRGLIRAKGRHHAQGFELTGKGRALVSEVARRYSPTLPSNGGEPAIQRLPVVRESAREPQND